MKLLEVVSIPETSEETSKAMMEWGKAMGKTTVAAKDTPGNTLEYQIIVYII